MCDYLISINVNMINIIRSYILPNINEVKDEKSICMNELFTKTIYLCLSLDNNTCLDTDGSTIYLDLKNSKIKYIKFGNFSRWSIRKLEN